MDEKRTDFAKLMCWIVLGIAGFVLVVFFIGLIYTTIMNYLESKKIERENQNKVVIEKTDESDSEKHNEISQNEKDSQRNDNDGKNDTSKIATVETHYNYMQGFKDGTFGPNEGVSRAEVATIFSRLDPKFDENKAYQVTRYSDVSSTSWYSNYVGYCSRELIMQGYNDGTFKPNEKMKKIEFLAAAVKYVEVDYFGYTSKYEDVKGTWAEAYIGYLEANGFVTGKTETILGAQDNITRAEVCNVINNILNRKPNKSLVDATEKKAYFTDVKKTDWFYYDVVEATTFHDITLYHAAK